MIWMFSEAKLFTIQKKKICAIGMIVLWLISLKSVSAQQILNGSFEENVIDCGINMTNDAFNAEMFYITAFGGQSEIDVLNKDCGYGLAQDGEEFVALYNNTFSDAFTFELSKPLEANRLYKIRYAARVGTGIRNYNSQVVLGTSQEAEAFGTHAHTSVFLDTIWRYYEAQFSLSESHQFLSVRINSFDETWVFLDDFSIECPVVDIGRDTAYCEVRNIVLMVPDFFIEYAWSTNAVDPMIVIHHPGEYWIEATDGTCVVRDTIVIEELPFNCQCPVFVPNVFSPNHDDINDTMTPLSPCLFDNYQLNIFDRWGSVVFSSRDPQVGWNGNSHDGGEAPSGVYGFVVQYQFYYQSEVTFTSGDITLIR